MKIIKYIPNKSGGKVKAFFDVSIDMMVDGVLIPGGLEVKGLKLIEGEKGMFIGSPSKKYEKDGETKYLDDVWITDPVKGPLLDLALAQADPATDGVPF